MGICPDFFNDGRVNCIFFDKFGLFEKIAKTLQYTFPNLCGGGGGRPHRKVVEKLDQTRPDVCQTKCQVDT